ncbi:Endo-1,4-beta-xylanase/feruloyl esterase precursor [compost metagenome]
MKMIKGLILTLFLALLVEPLAVASAAKDRSASSTMKVNFYSDSLQKKMHLNVYLPPNYEAQNKYPVLYVLHSYKLNEDHWWNSLKVTEKADELIASGKIEPLIIVAPMIDNSFGVNSAEQTGTVPESGKPEDEGVLYKGKYEDYITKDVINYIDTHFKTNKSRSSRYLGGTSMGGFAALHIGFSHPELYGKVGGHSPALFVGPMWDVLEKVIYPTEAARKLNDPILLAGTQKLNKQRIYLDMGDKDDFLGALKTLDQVLSKRQTKSYELHVNPGGKHDDAYWSSQMENYLLFYAGLDRD